MDRRTALKVGALGSASALGVPLLTGSAVSWKGITIEVDCAHPTDLAKFEVEGGTFQVEEDFGADLVGSAGTSYTFEDDDGEFTIDLEGIQYDESDEIEQFSFTSDTGRVGFVVVKGGPDEEEFYVNPEELVSDGDGLHAPINPNPPTTENYGVSNVQFYECSHLEVLIRSVENGVAPGDVFDLANDEIRFAVWHGPWRHSDQHVFDNGVAPAQGNGEIYADGTIRFTFELSNVIIDDPEEVADSTRFVAQLLIEQPNGETWAGQVPFPLV